MVNDMLSTNVISSLYAHVKVDQILRRRIFMTDKYLLYHPKQKLIMPKSRVFDK